MTNHAVHMGFKLHNLHVENVITFFLIKKILKILNVFSIESPNYQKGFCRLPQDFPLQDRFYSMNAWIIC